ncbi:MAG: FAD-dependent oxidoreductase [Rhodothermales bacterium]|nr:FAD-dependent oxidoreductase [Rhodothermales bacterium]MBO6779952.1 FAD-dependent oxidoreductase [Rhodothermales bacterium]
MIEKTRLGAEELAQNFSDLHPALTRDEAVAAAARCLYCYDAPCTRACPTGIDVPSFIRDILHDNPLGAAETIFEENIFGGSCARACPTEVLCEGACVDRTLLKEPVEIGRLQRFATDAAAARAVRFFEPGPDTGKRVAIVGGGPAGLTCGFELRKMGHAAAVFEAREVAGGLNTLGLSPYKVTTEFALSEIEPIEEMGVDIRLGEHVDAERLATLRSEYDAVFVAVGLGQTRTLDLPGAGLPGIVEALDFIFPAHLGPLTECRVGRHVVVVGAGNTAIDVATQAVRLGAETVTIAYRRGPGQMSAFAYEYELAKQDGVVFDWFVRPAAFEGNAHVEGIRLQPVDPESFSDAGSTRVLPCDMVIMALGQEAILDQLGRLGQGVFVGGDCESGGAEIVDAVQDGKNAAQAIDAYLKA